VEEREIAAVLSSQVDRARQATEVTLIDEGPGRIDPDLGVPMCAGRCDLLRWDADVQLAGAEAAGPGPDVAVEPQVKIAEEVIGQDLVDGEGAVSYFVQEVLGYLGENCRLGFVRSVFVGSSPSSARACPVSAASSGSSGVSL
jgi:hypothetical protein